MSEGELITLKAFGSTIAANAFRVSLMCQIYWLFTFEISAGRENLLSRTRDERFSLAALVSADNPEQSSETPD